MKHQRGVALSGLIFWGIVITLVAVLGMKVVPTTIEYYKILKGVKATVAKVGPDATVADVRKTFDNFATVDRNSTSRRNNSTFRKRRARSSSRSTMRSGFRCSAMSVW